MAKKQKKNKKLLKLPKVALSRKGTKHAKCHPVVRQQHSEKNCDNPKHLLQSIENLRIAEAEDDKHRKLKKLKPIEICFRNHEPVNIPKLKPVKLEPIRKTAVMPAVKVQAKTPQVKKVPGKILPTNPPLPSIKPKLGIPPMPKVSGETKHPEGLDFLGPIPEEFLPEDEREKKLKVSQQLLASVKTNGLMKGKKHWFSRGPAPVEVKKAPLDHDIEMIRLPDLPDIEELTKAPKVDRPLEMIKDFEAQANEALLKKALAEDKAKTRSADFRPLPSPVQMPPLNQRLPPMAPRLLPPPLPPRVMSPPPRPPPKSAEKRDWNIAPEKQPSNWGIFNKPENERPLEKPEIDSKVRKRMMRHRNWASYTDVEETDISEIKTIEPPPEIFRGPEVQNDNKSWTIKSQLDDVLELIRQKGCVNAVEISRRFNVGLDIVENWGKILEENKLIEIHYPAMGEPDFTRPGYTETGKDIRKKH